MNVNQELIYAIKFTIYWQMSPHREFRDLKKQKNPSISAEQAT